MGEERMELIDSYIESYTVNETLANKARASSRYFAAALGVFDKNVKSRKLIVESIKISRGLPEAAKMHVVIFSLTHPLSFFLLKVSVKFSKKMKTKMQKL
jgi:hypothetical protein